MISRTSYPHQLPTLAAAVLIAFGLIACGDTITRLGEEEGAPTDGDSTPPPEIACSGPDGDGDGLPDCQEESGWLITVDYSGFGIGTETMAASDPQIVDSDGDGLSDYAEFFSRTHPGTADTDGDGLDDETELTVYFSNPANVDSDGDARPKDQNGQPTGFPSPQLFDGNELIVRGTSPTLADTDGDGLSDYEEIVGGGTNPLVADIPKLEIDFVGDVDVLLDSSLSDNCAQSTSTLSATLRRRETAYSRADARSTSRTLEVGATVSAEVSGGVFPPTASGSVSTTASVNRSTTQTNSTSFTSNSASAAQQQFQNSTERTCFSGSETTGGFITMGFQISNSTPIGFTLQDLNLTVLQRDLGASAAFKTLGTVTPLGAAVNLGPRAATGTLAVQANVPAGRAMELLANPAGLFFEVGTFNIEDELGRNYAFINQTALARTGLVIVDFGDLAPAERHSVATNVERNPDGTPAGVTMARALQILGIPYTTEPGNLPGGGTGGEVLASLNGIAHDEAVNQFWYVFGSPEGLGDPQSDFEELILRQGDVIHLVLLKDRDQDGLFDREEFVHGTDPLVTDTDGDTLTDFEELKEGWPNAFAGIGLFFSSPVSQDGDADTIADADERDFGTDALNPDTDGDQASDGYELLTAGRDPFVPHRVAVGDNFALAKTRSGTLWGWGGNVLGYLGTGDTLTRPTPGFVDDGIWDMVAAGLGHAMVLKFDGTLWAMGGTAGGSTGLGAPDAFEDCELPGGAMVPCSIVPRQVAHPFVNGNWAYVSAGYDSTFMLDDASRLFATGFNPFGHLGLGDDVTRFTPEQVGADTGWEAVSAGVAQTVGIRNGSLYAWGSDLDILAQVGPQLPGSTCGVDDGTGPATESWTPQPVDVGVPETFEPFVAVSAGRGHSLILDHRGFLFVCGTNEQGQASHLEFFNPEPFLEETAEILSPVWIFDVDTGDPIGPMFQVRTMAAGWAHSLAIREDGSLWFWGTMGQGDPIPTPTQVGTDTDWVAVHSGASGRQAVAIKADGSIWVWGEGSEFRLGLGDLADRFLPVRMPDFGP